MLIGIKPGESRQASAGATRRVVRLAISDDGRTVTIDDRRVALAPDVLVLWHQDDAGTYHGIKDPVELQTSKASRAAALTVGGDGCPVRGVELRSSSGGRDIAALAIKVDRPLAVVTSGYQGRRGWQFLLVAPDGQGGLVSERITPVEYRARFAPAENL